MSQDTRRGGHCYRLDAHEFVNKTACSPPKVGRAADEPRQLWTDKTASAGAFCRCCAPFLYRPSLLAIAGPALADDMDALPRPADRGQGAPRRLRKGDRGRAGAGKDLGIANAVRGQAFRLKGNNDKAIAAFDAAHAADPDALEYVTWRGLAYERKGDDEHAMADYNLVLQTRPNAALALNFRGTLYLRQGALQSALDDFNAAVNVAPNLYIARVNRGRVLTINKDYDGALADFAEAERIDPAGAAGPAASLSHLYRHGQVRQGALRIATP